MEPCTKAFMVPGPLSSLMSKRCVSSIRVILQLGSLKVNILDGWNMQVESFITVFNFLSLICSCNSGKIEFLLALC